jgi:hypothetical protein
VLHGRGPALQQVFDNAKEEGVVVTRKLLKGLHVPAGQSPKTLKVEGPSGRPQEVQVLAVVEQSLPPDDREFAMPEAFYVKLKTQDPNVRTAAIETGPVPQAWLAKGLPKDLQAILSNEGVQMPPVWRPVERDGRELDVWMLNSREARTGLRVDIWRKYLEMIRDTMTKDLLLPPGPDFVTVVPLDKKQEEAPPKRHRHLAVYLSDLPDLKPAAEVIDTLGFPVNRDVVNQVDSVQQSTAAIFVLLLVIVAVVGGLAVWNTTVIQQLRAQQKVTEIGMLKAIGMTNRQMQQLYLVEASLLWFFGALAGVGLGLLAGRAVEAGIPPDAQGRVIEFDCPWCYIVVGVGASLLLCLFSTLWATRKARRDPPIRSLTTG